MLRTTSSSSKRNNLFMKKRLTLLSSFFLFCSVCFALGDTISAIRVEIKVKKEYEIRHSKAYYESLFCRPEFKILTDSANEKRYDIDVTISNCSKQTKYIWLMHCSWEDNILVNNDYMYIVGRDCDMNFPELVELKPNESKLYKTTIKKSIKFDNPLCHNCIYGKQVEETKLGLIVGNNISKVKDSYAELKDKSNWKIIWSNPLYLLTKKEAFPEPVSFPVNNKQ